MQQQTEFAMVPEADQLASVPRRIEFFPSTVTNPKTLSIAQIAQYNRLGYVSDLDVFEPDEIARHRVFFDDLLDQTLAAGKDSYSISSAHLKYGQVYDLLSEPKIVRYVKDLLGEDVIGWGSHYFCKMPGDGKQVDWHQDCSFWPLTPTKAVTVWLAIDDADTGNGCMEVIEGSHQQGLIEFTSSSETNVLNQTVTDPDRYGRRQPTPLRAGQISIHSDLLLHGSMPNHSTRRRCGLTLRYCPAEVNAYLGWNQKGIVVAGKADPKKWPGARRPTP
jgi:non-haem Fe2+, alpha-ketoglutarate-dependent halogenase